MDIVKTFFFHKVHFKLFFSLLLLGLLAGPAQATEITVAPDRNPVGLDESFQLVFTANASPDAPPDFSPLETDFSILGKSKSNNVVINNNVKTSSHQWTLTVMAKKSGSLAIPAIQFGADSSPPTTVMVTANTGTGNINSGADLSLEVETNLQAPYVQSQLIYTVHVLSRVPLLQGKLSEPELPDAVVKKLGDEKKYTKNINGEDYQIIEINYAIFPQKSGKLTIKPLELTAEVLIQGQQNYNGFPGIFSNQQTKTKRVVSKEVTLNVKPSPASFNGKHWLSAEQVEFAQQWSGDFTQLKIGEPITRTLTLQANGAAVSQLPELSKPDTDDALKSYPDQPVLKEQPSPDGLVAFRQEKIALIPSKPGSYILPAIEIPWFNLKTQKMEVAKIPETTLNAVGAAPSELQKSNASPKPELAEIAANNEPPTSATETQASAPIWLWVSIFLGIGWLSTLIFFLKWRPVPKPSLEDTGKILNLKLSAKNLKAACLNNDAPAAKDALLAWGRIEFGVTSLGAIASLCNEPLCTEIMALNQTLYGQYKELWSGKNLFQAFSENKYNKKLGVAEDISLAPLFRL